MIASSNRWSSWMGPLVLGVSITFAVRVPGEINETDSIEWIVCESTVVAIGKISEIKRLPGPEGATYEVDECTLAVNDIIKGEPKSQITFLVDPHRKAEASWKQSDRDLLVLLRLYYGQEHLTPTRSHAPLTIIDLSELPETLYDKDVKRVTDREALLALCRTWAKSDAQHSLSSEVPYDSKLYEKLWRGSAVFLKVPAEEKHRLKFLAAARSTAPRERETAARMLWKFPGAESEAALRSLYADSTEGIRHWSNDPHARIRYDIRSSAARSLKQLGHPVTGLVLEREPTAEEKEKFRHEAWQHRIKEVIQDGWQVTAVRDGEARSAGSGQYWDVEVDLSKGEEQCTLVMVPKVTGIDLAPGGVRLRIEDLGVRDFHAPNGIPPALRDLLTKHHGLVDR